MTTNYETYDAYEDDDALEPWERNLQARVNAAAYEKETGERDETFQNAPLPVSAPVVVPVPSHSAPIQPVPSVPAPISVPSVPAPVSAPVYDAAPAPVQKKVKPYVVPGEIAENLGIARATVMKLLKENDITVIKVGNRHRIPREAAEKLYELYGF